MKKFTHYILRIALPAMAWGTLLLSDATAADSIIRIIGDKSSTTPKGSGGTALSEPVTIRIIGDKQDSAPKPSGDPKILPEPLPPSSSKNEIRIISDKSEPARISGSGQPASSVEKTGEATATKESITKDDAEQALAQRLKALELERAQKAAQKAEQEQKERAARALEEARQAAIKQEQEQIAARLAVELRVAAEKAEQEKIAAEAAQKAARQKEQEQLAARMAEQARIAAEKAEQERVTAQKAEEERLAFARRALLEKPLPDATTLLQQPQTTESPTTQALPLPEVTVGGKSPDTSNENNATLKSAPTPDNIWNLYLSAKASDPALSRMEARVTGSKADSDILMAGLLPHIDSSAGVKQISQKLANYTSKDLNYDFTALNYNVTARMTLLHVPTLYSLSASAANLKVEQAGVAAARQTLIVKFADAYFALLKAQTDKQIALGEINRLKQVLDQSKAFLKEGTGDIIAVYEAQSRLDSAAADLNKSESNLRLAEQKLSTVVGKSVTSVENYLPQYPTGPDPDNLEWWLATMEKEQPAVQQAREGLAQTTAQRKAAKSEYLPILQASGGYDVNRGTAALPSAEVRQWFVGASISLPLYSGGETSAKVRRATASEDERRHLLDETMDQQRENVKQAFFNLRYNISYIKALEQKKASAEIQLAAVNKGRKIGARNAIDLLNAEQAYSVALRDYSYALYDNFIRVIQLKSATGILSETDISEIPKSAAPMLASRLR